ncbi:MAG: Hsp20/alpha crystallin family protein [Bacteroidales bacterium]|nr:Hsp20/alpha crystallin family protein [Bacteroidales bacterium]
MLFRDLMNVNPWQEMDHIREEMNRLFNAASRPAAQFYPAMNIWTSQDTAVIMAELPGYRTKDIQLSITNDELEIKGSRQQEDLKDGEQFHPQERGYGECERTLRLPFLVDTAKVDARLENGILKLTLPRAEADKPKKIEIKTS